MTLLASLSVIQATVHPATAQTSTVFWQGSNGNSWDVASNWSSNALPNSNNDVENTTGNTIAFSDLTTLINSFLNTSSGGFTMTGGSLSTTLNFKNSGSGGISIQGGTLDVGQDLINTASGTITVSGGTLNVGRDFTNSGGAALTFSGGTANITNNFSTTGAVNIADTFTVGGASTLAGTTNSLVNANATFTGGLTQTGGTLLVQGGSLTTSSLTLNNGVVLDLSQNPTLNGSFVFGNTSGNTTGGHLYLEGQSSGTAQYTLPAGTTLSGNLAGIGTSAEISTNPSQLTNLGTILLNSSGQSTTLGSGASDLTTFLNSGTLQVANGNNLTLNAVNTTNSNNGTIEIESNSTATLNFGLTQTGGTTQVDGIMQPATGQSLLITGGVLAGTGKVTGPVINSAGTVTPGDLLSGSQTGTFQISKYTQQSTATTLIELGGTQQGVTYDLLKVTSLASLAGALDVKLINGFTPTVGEIFDFLNYGSRNGIYDSVVALDNGFSYSVSYNDGTGIGTLTVDTVVSSVPETSTVVTAGLMLGMGGLLIRRRGRALVPVKRAA